MKRKTYTIAFLSLTALGLLAANILVPQRATGQVAVAGGDYQVVTAKIQQGGDGLYILDNSTGRMALFSYDPATKSVRLRAVKPVDEAFAAGAGVPKRNGGRD